MCLNINIVGHFDNFNGNLCATINKESTHKLEQENRKAIRKKVKWIYGVKMITITVTDCVAKRKKKPKRKETMTWIELVSL